MNKNLISLLTFITLIIAIIILAIIGTILISIDAINFNNNRDCFEDIARDYCESKAMQFGRVRTDISFYCFEDREKVEKSFFGSDKNLCYGDKK